LFFLSFNFIKIHTLEITYSSSSKHLHFNQYIVNENLSKPYITRETYTQNVHLCWGHNVSETTFSMSLKETVSRDFRLRVFFINQLPVGSWKNPVIISNSVSNSRRNSYKKYFCLNRLVTQRYAT
jgi:hypothetical protein